MPVAKSTLAVWSTSTSTAPEITSTVGNGPASSTRGGRAAPDGRAEGGDRTVGLRQSDGGDDVVGGGQPAAEHPEHQPRLRRVERLQGLDQGGEQAAVCRPRPAGARPAPPAARRSARAAPGRRARRAGRCPGPGRRGCCGRRGAAGSAQPASLGALQRRPTRQRREEPVEQGRPIVRRHSPASSSRGAARSRRAAGRSRRRWSTAAASPRSTWRRPGGRR